MSEQNESLQEKFFARIEAGEFKAQGNSREDHDNARKTFMKALRETFAKPWWDIEFRSWFTKKVLNMSARDEGYVYYLTSVATNYIDLMELVEMNRELYAGMDRARKVLENLSSEND